jgi:hypothetical protein
MGLSFKFKQPKRPLMMYFVAFGLGVLAQTIAQSYDAKDYRWMIFSIIIFALLVIPFWVNRYNVIFPPRVKPPAENKVPGRKA